MFSSIDFLKMIWFPRTFPELIGYQFDIKKMDFIINKFENLYEQW